jgi:hypothetical protein
MPLPSSYSEASLIALMETEVGPLLAPLGLDVSDALLEASNEVAALLGHAVASETDVAKLRTLARWQAWLAAYSAAANQFDLKTGTSSLTRSQMFGQIERRLALAERAARRYPEAAVLLSGGLRRPVVGQIATTAPATPLYPPDPNSPIYSGRPGGWWP